MFELSSINFPEFFDGAQELALIYPLRPQRSAPCDNASKNLGAKSKQTKLTISAYTYYTSMESIPSTEINV
jgi:hypothetical protein